MQLIRTAIIGLRLKRCLFSSVQLTFGKPFSSIECLKAKSLFCERKVVNLPKLYGIKYEQKNCTRTFRTTNKNEVPAIISLVLRPIGKAIAMLLGRGIRNWWKNLPEDKRLVFKAWIYKNRTKLWFGFGSVIVLFYVYYDTHLQKTPLTGRRRFIAFTDKQYEKIVEFEYKNLLQHFGGSFLPNSHVICKKVENIANRLLLANKDIPQIYDKKWSVCVVEAPNVKNAFVLPSGQIFVFTGILSTVSNDDQLGTVIAHEMSHAILGHGAELLSHAHILDIIVIASLCLLWAVIPFDTYAALLTWLYHKIVNVIFNLPYNRMLETEADEIGLKLAAKACFDVREAVVFWRKMSLTEKEEIKAIFGESDIPQMEYLSTHPSHDSRAENIENLLPKAIEIRNACNCPKLPRTDPRVLFEHMKRAITQRPVDNVIILKHPPRPPGM